MENNKVTYFTTRNNKLIAEFMGLVVSDRDNYTSELHTNVDADLKYHTSWDWLIPVVKKINKSSGQGVLMLQIGLPIEYVYANVVEIIKEHNDGEQ